jgi:hypothetical protein
MPWRETLGAENVPQAVRGPYGVGARVINNGTNKRGTILQVIEPDYLVIKYDDGTQEKTTKFYVKPLNAFDAKEPQNYQNRGRVSEEFWARWGE